MSSPYVRIEPADRASEPVTRTRVAQTVRGENVRNACERCRILKQKCSGVKPCMRCVRSKVECVIPGRNHERLQRDLQEHKTSIHKIFELLQKGEQQGVLQQIASNSQDAGDFTRRISMLSSDVSAADEEEDDDDGDVSMDTEQSVVDAETFSLAKIGFDRSNDPWFSSSFEISDVSVKSFLISGLKQIYQNSMETSLSCWLTPQNSPYERRLTVTRSNSAQSSATQPMLLYERAHYLDRAFSELRTAPLSILEDMEASRALNIATLAFASQWSVSSSSGFAASPLSADEKARDTSSLEYQIRRRLWTQLEDSLARLHTCTSFRVITAKLILFFIAPPLDTGEKNTMHGILSDQGNIPESGMSTPSPYTQTPGASSHVASGASQSSSSTSQASSGSSKSSGSASETSGANLLFDLLAAESRADHLRTAIHHLSWWSRRIKLFLSRTSRPSGHAYQAHLRERIQQACPQFNLLCWFSVMLDTARATLHRRPLILDDRGTEALIVRHDEEEQADVMLDVEGSGATDQTGEVWQPLLSKPYSPCDDPFQSPRVDFAKRMGRVLQDATPMTVLIIRKAAHLQSAMEAVSDPETVEHCIAEVLDVCTSWDVQYRKFFDNCMSEHMELPFTIRSWYLMILGHWLVGCLRGIELIDDHDNDPTVSSPQQSLRLSTSVVLWLQKDYSYKIANLARVSSLDSTINVTDQSNLHYHPVMRPGSLLTEPGPDIMIFGLKSACDVMLGWMEVMRTPESDVRDVWVRRNTTLQELIGNVSACVDAMGLLGKLSAFAESTASVYRQRLAGVRWKMGVDVHVGEQVMSFK